MSIFLMNLSQIIYRQYLEIAVNSHNFPLVVNSLVVSISACYESLERQDESRVSSSHESYSMTLKFWTSQLILWLESAKCHTSPRVRTCKASSQDSWVWESELMSQRVNESWFARHRVRWLAYSNHERLLNSLPLWLSRICGGPIR